MFAFGVSANHTPLLNILSISHVNNLQEMIKDLENDQRFYD